ncbi:MAG: hypothetical protein ACREDT_10035 [Methylocella sp.]
MSTKIHPGSVLFMTLDSCRYDSFVSAHAPNLHAVGRIHKAQAPSYFTYGSHAAMFVGFTPGVAHEAVALLNPKFGKIFKLAGAGFPGKGREGFLLEGSNIIDGFNKLGYYTVGTGAVGWFNPAASTSRVLIADFKEFFYPGVRHSVEEQLCWIDRCLEVACEGPVFVFINIGETHVPYYFKGAPWPANDNCCVPFQVVDRSEECRMRQICCVEFVDRQIGGLLSRFLAATTLVTADHGDCWGEDGLWEHGVSHPMTLSVPLVLRMHGRVI